MSSHRIETVQVANFRGITDARTIDVSKKHLFLLGPNGFGKSTIVEAIRWCLFGLPSGQPEIEVRNTFFPSNTSQVILRLVATDKRFTVQRSLNPGSSQSRRNVTDRDDKPVNFGDAFPQLTRLGHPTGTQVIFAAQHAPGRRQVEISDFSRVLHFYLGIEEVPDLLKELTSDRGHANGLDFGRVVGRSGDLIGEAAG